MIVYFLFYKQTTKIVQSPKWFLWHSKVFLDVTLSCPEALKNLVKVVFPLFNRFYHVFIQKPSKRITLFENVCILFLSLRRCMHCMCQNNFTIWFKPCNMAYQHDRNFIGYKSVVVEQGYELISLLCMQISKADAGQATWWSLDINGCRQTIDCYN